MQIKNARIEKIDTKCAFGQFKYSITIDYKLQNSDSDQPLDPISIYNMSCNP